jgi:hypothetical protein
LALLKGDSYRNTHPDLTPNRIKIDVEGFEYEVLLGLSEALKSSQLCSVFIEVHFHFPERKRWARLAGENRNAPESD